MIGAEGVFFLLVRLLRGGGGRLLGVGVLSDSGAFRLAARVGWMRVGGFLVVRGGGGVGVGRVLLLLWRIEIGMEGLGSGAWLSSWLLFLDDSCC
jgi:hypothetical protein